MKNFVLLLIVILSFSVKLFSQDDIAEFKGEIKWSELFEVSSKISAPEIIGQDGEYVYLTRIRSKKNYIEKYNIRTLKLEKSVLLELKFNEKPLDLLSTYMFNDAPVLYTNFYNQKTKINYSFVQTINTTTLIPSDPILVSQSNTPKTKGILMNIAMTTLSDQGGLSSQFIVSEDNKLGYTSEVNYADTDKKATQIVVKGIKGKLYDENLKLIHESEYNIPYPSFEVTNTKLSNEGLLYMSGFQTSISKDQSGIIKKDTKVYGELEILVLDIETGEIRSLEVSTDDRKIVSYTFKIKEDGSLIVAGLISKGGGGVSGSFYAEYDANLKEVAMKFNDFESEFITQNWSEKQLEKLEKRNEKEDKKGKENSEANFYSYSIRDLIVKPNGTTALIAEQYYVEVVTRTYTSSNGQMRTVTDYYYYYNDIIVLNHDKSGEIAWKSIIKKRQKSKNDGGYYSSFFTTLEGNDINIVYNYLPVNREEAAEMTAAEKKAIKRSYIGLRVLVDESGEQANQMLFEFEEGGLRIVPKICGQAGKDVVFLYARSPKGDKIGLINW